MTTTTTTTAAGGWPALNKEQETAAGGGRRRRTLVGSRAPTCTYNECRGCRHRCSVQEVPIDASDPINSAYHYKCICHL
jgi:anaerobic selenocysteine-containing dehydrogenase